jgi:phage terminase large subunit GpA-like protein
MAGEAGQAAAGVGIVSAITHDGYYIATDAVARGLEPDPDMPMDEWADKHMIVPKETGASEPGPYRTTRTPHARMVMRWLSASHPCKRVVVKGASQMLKTQVALNFLGERVHQRPKNFLWLVPTGKLHKRAVARIDKVIRAVDVLRERFAKPTSRGAKNNNDIKEYPGGALYLATAGAAANLSELSATYLVYDEIDRSDENVDGEGDPKELGETRLTSHEKDRKAYYPSSPTIEGESAIQELYDSGTQRVALAECVACGHAQPLEFFKEDGTPRLHRSEDGKRAMYPCSECGYLHEEGDKPRMFARGLWSEGVPGDGETESAEISAMFLPYGWLPWIGLLKQYDKAKSRLEEGDDTLMITFYNTRLAKCWARTKETTRYDALMNRAEEYRLGTVPARASILTAAIDVQTYRLEFLVMGWGPGMESWVVDYQIIHGSPADAETWQKADALLAGRYRHASGAWMNITGGFVDSGGSNTQDVYNFTGPLRRRKIFAVKGHSRPNRPIISARPTFVDYNSRGRVEHRGGELWFVGPDTAKDYLQARWNKASGPGSIHFAGGVGEQREGALPESFYKGLVAEYRTSKFKRGRRVSVWEQKKAEPNEPLDLVVYNLGVAHQLGLHKKTEDGWQKLRDRLVPSQGDLLSQADPSLDTYPNSGETPSPGPGAPEQKQDATSSLFTPIELGQ